MPVAPIIRLIYWEEKPQSAIGWTGFGTGLIAPIIRTSELNVLLRENCDSNISILRRCLLSIKNLVKMNKKILPNIGNIIMYLLNNYSISGLFYTIYHLDVLAQQ